MTAPLFTAEALLSSDGKYPERAVAATDQQHASFALLAARLNALYADLGLTTRRQINEGLRPRGAKWGAKRSAHKSLEPGIAAVDLDDPEHNVALRVTRQLLAKHGLRREDTRDTPTWLHLDTYKPYGIVFRP